MNDVAKIILKGKRILVFQQRGWGIKMGHYLAKQMQKEGCTLAALTFKKSTHAYTVNQTEVKYDFIVNDDEIAENPEKYLGNDVFSLSEICKELGVDTVWPFITTLRHYVRTYKDKYYYGFKQNMSDEEMVSYMFAVFKYMKYFFDEFRPDVIVAPIFGDLRHIFFNCYAKKNGIPMIAVIDSKIRDHHIFTRSYSYLNNKGMFYDRIDELNNGKVDSVNRERARKYIHEFRKKFIRPEYTEFNLRKKSFRDRIREQIDLFRDIYERMRKPLSEENPARLGVNPGNKPVHILVRDHVEHIRNERYMKRFSYYPFEKLGKFAYFPLQVQPEMTIDVMAPYFNNQIETIRQCAQSLPDDYTLVVKEHPEGIGRRPRSYIDKINRTPNVKLIDYRTSTSQVLENTDLVISVSSTTAAEAAFYSKPVIQLGNLGTTLKLPNVYHHTDMTTLTSKIKEVIGYNLGSSEYELQLENYVAAVYDTGFDFRYSGTWFRGEKRDLAPLWSLFKKEIERALVPD